MHFYWAIINLIFIWNIDLNNGVYCATFNKSACTVLQTIFIYWWCFNSFKFLLWWLTVVTLLLAESVCVKLQMLRVIFENFTQDNPMPCCLFFFCIVVVINVMVVMVVVATLSLCFDQKVSCAFFVFLFFSFCSSSDVAQLLLLLLLPCCIECLSLVRNVVNNSSSNKTEKKKTKTKL